MTGLLTPSEALQRRFELPQEQTSSAPAPVARERRYGLSLHEYGLLLPAGTLCEVADQLPLCRLPNTPAWFCGVVNQRGNMVPVLDIGTLLAARDPQPGAREWTLIVGQRDGAVGLRVQHLPRTVYVSGAERLRNSPATHERLDRFVSATYHCEGTLWFEWDMDGFFSSVAEAVNTG